MCDFKCDVCTTANNDGYTAISYNQWVEHLLTEEHQYEVRKKQNVKKRWKNEEDTYVLIEVLNGRSWSRLELADWLSTFGTITQFMHNDRKHFYIFTVEGFGQAGRERIRSILNQNEFMGHSFQIKLKSSYGPREWDSVYEAAQSTSRSAHASNESIGKFTTKPPQTKNDQVPSTTATSSAKKVPKGSLVFVNKNLSSANDYLQTPERSSNGNNNHVANKESVNNSNFVQTELLSGKGVLSSNEQNQILQSKTSGDLVTDTPARQNKKRTRGSKEKSHKEQHLLEQTSIDPSPRTSREITPRASAANAIAVPPSSLIPNDQSLRVNENYPTIQKVTQQEPLNFRGGFGRRGHESKISESSDGSNQPEAMPAIVKTPSSTASSSKSSQVQILQRSSGKDSSNDGSKSQKQKQKWQPLNKRNQGPGNQSSSFPLGPNVHQRQLHNSGSYHHQQSFLLSPVFTSQISPTIVASLSNPNLPTSRNPYKFENMPPFPHFFDLFQKLPDESFKPQKELLFKQFQKLPLPDQLEEFFLAHTLPFPEIRLRWQVILDILFLLRQQFPRCEIYAFGSILTGLGDFMSDIDLYVDLVGESTSAHAVDPLQRLAGQEAVDIVKKIIRRSLCPHNKNRFVKQLIPVKSARIPILKLTHQATLLNCDLSFENRLSVQNTKLLFFYLNLDIRIFRFMVLIRYWGKFHHLTGSNHIKNYALTLLVLVYLTKKGFVPPVELLQRLKAAERQQKRVKSNPDEIDGWDASFCDNISVVKQNFEAVNLPSSENASANNNYISQSRTLIQMTIEFFEMYSNVDFTKVVVCPLLGDILPKEQFYPGSEESLPDTLNRYKSWAAKQAMNRRLNVKTHLCVQDPFVLSFNVGSVTPQGTLFRFQIACAKSLQILKQNNGLKSLLDVLVRLPAHVGEKKFMKTYKTEAKGEELKREIKATVLDSPVTSTTEDTPGSSSSSSSPQVSSFVKLPAHLQSFDKLMDEKGLKQTAKRPRWEIFVDFTLCSQFEDTFIAELARCKLLNNKRSVLMDTLCTLWQQFSLDFVKEFFERGLKLTTLEKRDVAVERYDNEASGADGGKSSIDEEGKRKRWKLKMLNKQEEEKLLLQTETITPRSKETVSRLSQQISELPRSTGVINYFVVTYKVTYPFWEKRPTILDQVVKEMKSDEMIKVPVLPTIRKPKKDKGNKGKRNKAEEKSVEGKSGYWESFNPVNLETRVSETILKSYKLKETQQDFTEFQFSVLIKLDLSLVGDRPEIFFIFEKDHASTNSTNDYLRAFQCLANILTEAFHRYQIYRLVKWLDMPYSDNTVTNANTLPSALEKLTVAESLKVGNGNNSSASNEKGTGRKSGGTKIKSKLEEDLLIPSSSSSTCSNDNENDDGLEDISNDEDGDDSDDSNTDNDNGHSDGEDETMKPDKAN